jgi:RimJ/RimL family protein N-acetyltransferase
VLKGNKVLLRPVQKSDIAFFLKWYNDPEVLEYLSLYLPMTETMEEKWLEEAASTQGGTRVHFVIEVIEGKIPSPIGSIGLNKIDHRSQAAELGIAIGEKEYWSKGYGTEAARLLINYGFNQLNLNRIGSSVFAPNRRSLEMHRKLGFVKEGRQKQAFFKNGRFLDQVLFGLLKREWKGE